MQYTWALQFIKDVKRDMAWTAYPASLLGKITQPYPLNVSFDPNLVRSPFASFPLFYRNIFNTFARVIALNNRELGVPLASQPVACNDQLFYVHKDLQMRKNIIREVIVSKKTLNYIPTHI